MKNLRIERLANGLYRIFDFSTKSASVYNADGSYKFGDFRIHQHIVITLIASMK